MKHSLCWPLTSQLYLGDWLVPDFTALLGRGASPIGLALRGVFPVN